MIDCIDVVLGSMYMHYVGNKTNGERLSFADDADNEMDDDTKTYLMEYFLKPFSDNEVFNFHYPTGLELNDVYIFAKRIFENPGSMYETSKSIATHLYEKSIHPKINGGEFCVCYFENCYFNGEITNAIGLFKSEKKDVFLKLNSEAINHDTGVNIQKLDKGCMIFNIDEENGYKVCVVDSNKTSDAQYWKDEFLSIRTANDSFHHTKDFLNITKDFITKQIPEEFEVSKADQINFLNRSVDYFKTHETFDKDEFESEVFADENVIESFRKFDDTYRQEYEVEIEDNFEISSQAVKKQARSFKNILKLDKNFHIYIHGDRELIEQGVDENGRKYYKIYYENEA